MSLTQMKFDKVWTNPNDFPTYELHETKVRQDMQYLFDSIKNQFNYFLANEMAANNVTFAPTVGAITATDVQAAIEAVHQEVLDITQGSVADGSITTAKLDSTEGAEAVTTATIRNGAVTADKIANGSITSAKLASGAVDASVLAPGSVTHDLMAINSIGTNELMANCVTETKLGNEAVITAAIKNGAVTTDKVANGAVTYAKTSGVQQKHSTTTTTLAYGSGVKTWTKTGITEVTANNTVICTPAPESFAQWVDNRVRCTGQANGSLTFLADTAPSANITVNILVLNK